MLALALPATDASAREHVHHGYRHRVEQAQPQNPPGLFSFGQNFFQGFAPNAGPRAGSSTAYDGVAAQQAAANGVPVSLVNRVIMRESRGNARAVSRGNYGLMQIRLGTARAMGYSGSAEGLLDASTNMTYAVRYLAGAYRAAGGNENRAVALYARGYYQVAKAQNFSPYAAPSPILR
jgi:soluble lytic murein transglycosylase-like protein